MLRQLNVKNLTVFQEASFQFSKKLNLIIGENGTGKSHVLKAGYSTVNVCANSGAEKSGSDAEAPTKTFLQRALAEKLVGVFKPDQLGRLTRRKPGRERCEIKAVFSSESFLGFSFNSSSKKEVVVDHANTSWLEKLPVFIPTRELLTVAPGFVSLYETTHLPFEETYRDTCLLLGAPLAKGPRETKIKELLVPIEEAMGGKVEVDSAGRFYLKESTGNKIEMHLVAEGLRKLAMLARLIATGQLVDTGYLFWDEPEANLNPKVIKTLAKTILDLGNSGIQVFVATHSLFLMREIDILLSHEEYKETKPRFFGLHPSENGVSVLQGDSVDDVGEITSLQEDMHQSDRFLGNQEES
jgi:AAA15 family ATPase/GTPase